MPADLRARFEAACAANAVLAGLSGGTPAPEMTDTSGSSFRFNLAKHLHRAGGFDDTEIAALIWVCDHAGEQEKKTERELDRCVANSRPKPKVEPIDAAEEFAAIEITRGDLKGPLPAPWDPADVPKPRRRIYGNWVTEGLVTAVVAPPGLGKSTFVLNHCMAIASGRGVLGTVPVNRGNVLVWNMEDAREDMGRRVVAASRHYEIEQTDIDGLFLLSGFDRKLSLGEMVDGSPRVSAKGFDALEQMVDAYNLKVIVLDPWISVHGMPENANTEVDMVAKRLSALAARKNIAVIIVHHTKKLGGRDAEIEDSRGASALVGAVRTGVVLNPMSKDEASRFGIPNPRAFFRVDDAKQNFAPRAEKVEWYQIIGVSLDNASSPYPSDNVGVVVPWMPVAREIGPDDITKIQMRIAEGEWRGSDQVLKYGGLWAGSVVAKVLGLDISEQADLRRAKHVLNQLIGQGHLKEVRRRIDGRDVPFVAFSEAAISTADEFLPPAGDPIWRHPAPRRGAVQDGAAVRS